jgi:hypothetical protein
MVIAVPFLPGESTEPPALLGRFLPPISRNVVAGWLKENIAAGSTILDPFGSSPGAIGEAARAGYRVLVASSNPVLRFLVELECQPLLRSDLQAVLAELGSSKRGEERLEPHLRSLYQTTCPQCGLPIPAQAFIWEAKATIPSARLIECEKCRISGEFPTTPEDCQKAASFAEASIHRYRLLERIAPAGNPDRPHAEEALECYLPRAIYALSILINRIDGLLGGPSGSDHPEEVRRRSLIALALNALDQGNSLWAYPGGRPRPRQLSIPSRFRENNLWLALEEGVKQLSSTNPAIPLLAWPDLPARGGGITVFEGRLRDLSQELRPGSLPLEAVLAVIPRQNQAFWTLSAVWTSWLWGRQALGSFKHVLHRQRYDWAWSTSALHLAWSQVRKLIPAGLPLFGLLTEAEVGFISAALISARSANLMLRGLALRNDPEQAQLIWEPAPLPTVSSGLPEEISFGEAIREAVVETSVAAINQRNEPIPYLNLHTGILTELAERNLLPDITIQDVGEGYSQVQSAVEQVVAFRNGFLRYGGSEKTPHSSHWWHREASSTRVPHGDAVEMRLLQYLQEHADVRFADLDQVLCREFPGLETPGMELISHCLESYADQLAEGSQVWRLRPQESAAMRRRDLADIRNLLEELGTHLGYTCQGERPLVWKGETKSDHLYFYLQATAELSTAVLESPYPPDRCLIVLPGARATLAAFKLKRDPRLREKFEAGWRFCKFRHVRHLVQTPGLSQANLEELLALDPLTEAPAQMRLL